VIIYFQNRIKLADECLFELKLSKLVKKREPLHIQSCLNSPKSNYDFSCFQSYDFFLHKHVPSHYPFVCSLGYNNNNPMGGHGGLNILHQKKWNVYNLDNRMKVEKDKREAAEKERNKEIERRNKETEERLNMIRGDDEPERKDRRAQKEPEVKQNNLIAQELRNIQESKKHINLFENEQKMIENREVLEAKILKEREFLKDKSFDMSSKFLGAYSDQQRQPWYLKPSQKSQ
jgi:hypothetical protein